MGWTKEQFDEFCAKAGVKPEEALKLGQIDMDRGAKISAGKKKKAALSRSRKKSYETRVERGISISQPKPDSTYTLVAKARRDSASDEGADTRTRVCIKGYRVRCIDPDNYTGGLKALIDCLQLCGLIPDDSYAAIHLETSQTHVTTPGQERTVVTIEYPESP